MTSHHEIDKVLRRKFIQGGATVGFLAFTISHLSRRGPQHTKHSLPDHYTCIRQCSTTTVAPCEKEEFAVRLPIKRIKVPKSRAHEAARGRRKSSALAVALEEYAAVERHVLGASRVSPLSKKEYLALLDLEYTPQPRKPKLLPPAATAPLFEPNKATYTELADALTPEKPQVQDDSTNAPIKATVVDNAEGIYEVELQEALAKHLQNPRHGHLDDIYNLYQRLPSPRMHSLSHGTRKDLCRAFGRGKKTNRGMLRYFSLIDDLRQSGLGIGVHELNAAIAHASRYVGTSTQTEVEAALKLWHEMEHETGVKSNATTFNILFDVASKAGNFTLAEMIYDEMRRRKLPFNRFHHVSLIHMEGLRQDALSLRNAYRAAVEAGELVDTVMLNCAIAGLLRCGEEYAAIRIYNRMKDAHPTALDMAKRNYADPKSITKALMSFANIVINNIETRESLQAQAPILPDLATYRILVTHYAVKLGRLNMVAEFLDTMQHFQIPLHGSIFLAIFRGFAKYGHEKSDDWNLKQLGNVWQALAKALDGGAQGLTIETWLAVEVLNAFNACAPRPQVARVFREMVNRWELGQADERFMYDYYYDLLKKGRKPRQGYMRGVGRDLYM